LNKTLGTRIGPHGSGSVETTAGPVAGMALPGHRRAVQGFGDDAGILVHLAAPDAVEALCGLAVDLGTTRVVLRIIDLATGEASR
jgi:uncharacterized 2Fe-2S/4Fe-4S cluster protein (DUF4445 family)